MFKKYFPILVTALFTVSAIVWSCSKTNEVLPGNIVKSSNNSLALSKQDSLALDSLIKKYHLVKMSTASYPPGWKPLAVTSIADAKSFFANASAQTSKVKTTSGIFTTVRRTSLTETRTATSRALIVHIKKTKTANLEPGPIMSGIAFFSIPFGNWSTMDFRFGFDRNADNTLDALNPSAAVDGFTFGIGYTPDYQHTVYSSSPNSTTVSFAINGTFTAGISMGGGTFGLNTQYYYIVTLNVSTNRATVSEGPGYVYSIP